jgi:hypothetical protein
VSGDNGMTDVREGSSRTFRKEKKGNKIKDLEINSKNKKISEGYINAYMNLRTNSLQHVKICEL